MCKIISIIKFCFLFTSVFIFYNCEKENNLPRDGDGNEYDTVVIGTQTWLAENLKTTKYNNGVDIPLVTDNNIWASMNSAAFCWYDNSKAVKDNYGALYNWWAVNISFLCPVGYHVPTKEDWKSMIDYLGGEEIAGDKLKASGTQFWGSGNYATNESNFTAISGGWRMANDGSFNSLRSWGYWWCSTQGISENLGYNVSIFCSLSKAHVGNYSKQAGYSVRCVKD